MGSFAVHTHIQAPVAAVWRILDDIGTIHRWHPGVVDSHLTTRQASGIGACRRCDLGGSNYLDEAVVTWEENRRLTMRVVNTNMPVKTADIRFTLQPNGEGTKVTVSPQYAIKYGLLGQLLDQVYVRRSYRQGMMALLAGLKQYAENGG